jgi:hypothetical protein
MLAKALKWVVGVAVGGIIGNSAYDNVKALSSHEALVSAAQVSGQYVLKSYNPGYYVTDSYNPGWYKSK